MLHLLISFPLLLRITSLTPAYHTSHITLPQYPRITHLMQQKSEERHVNGGRVRVDRRPICQEIEMLREAQKNIISMHTWKSSHATAEASLNFTFCTVEGFWFGASTPSAAYYLHLYILTTTCSFSPQKSTTTLFSSAAERDLQDYKTYHSQNLGWGFLST